jgi:hypothetical protein
MAVTFLKQFGPNGRVCGVQPFFQQHVCILSMRLELVLMISMLHLRTALSFMRPFCASGRLHQTRRTAAPAARLWMTQTPAAAQMSSKALDSSAAGGPSAEQLIKGTKVLLLQSGEQGVFVDSVKGWFRVSTASGIINVRRSNLRIQQQQQQQQQQQPQATNGSPEAAPAVQQQQQQQQQRSSSTSSTSSSSSTVAAAATVTNPISRTSSTTLSSLSQSRFADLPLSEPSQRAIREVLGYEFMTTVQTETITTSIKGGDMLAKAKTGTGTLQTLAMLHECCMHAFTTAASA